MAYLFSGLASGMLFYTANKFVSFLNRYKLHKMNFVFSWCKFVECLNNLVFTSLNCYRLTHLWIRNWSKTAYKNDGAYRIRRLIQAVCNFAWVKQLDVISLSAKICNVLTISPTIDLTRKSITSRLCLAGASNFATFWNHEPNLIDELGSTILKISFVFQTWIKSLTSISIHSALQFQTKRQVIKTWQTLFVLMEQIICHRCVIFSAISH